VQRLGRVLRIKPDGRAAHLILLHASGTLEDPARGGHHGFLTQVADVARVRTDLVLPELGPEIGTGGAGSKGLPGRGWSEALAPLIERLARFNGPSEEPR
jgi:hypothetical protein